MMRAQEALLLAVTAGAAPLAAQQQTPPPWRWALDAPAVRETGQAVSDSGWRFVAMPPGWHVTMGPGGVLYDPAAGAHGRFAVESESFLFPGTSQAGYGVFVGGAALDGRAPRYVAFLVRRDGAVAIERREGASRTLLADWRQVDGVAPYPGSGTLKHSLRVDARADSVVFTVDGVAAAALARGDLPLDGGLGLRVGEGVNLHVATLDVTLRMAPARARSAEP